MKATRTNLLTAFRNNRQLYVLLAPAVIFTILFSYVPMSGIYFAFTRFNGDLWGSPLVGLDNFKFLFASGTMWTITRNTLLYNLAFIAVNTCFSVLTAILLNELRNRYFKKASQTVIFLPYFISFVLVAAFVYNICNYEFGVLNSLLKSLGAAPVNLYDDTDAWKYILVGLNLWKQIGYGTVIYLAAITGVDESLHEAAMIDGANIFQRIRYITIPHLVPTFIIILLFSIGSIMKGQFDMFYNVIGNNGLLYDSTDIIDTFVYRSLRVNFDIGMASAAGLYQSLFGFVIVVTVNAVIKRKRPEYALF